MGRNSKTRKSKAPKTMPGRFSVSEDVEYTQNQARRPRESREAKRVRASRERRQQKAAAERELEREAAVRLRQWMREEPNGLLEMSWNGDAGCYYWVWSHPLAYTVDEPRLMFMCRHLVEPLFPSHPLMSIWWSWAKLQAIWCWLWPKLQDARRAFLGLSGPARFVVAALLLALIRAVIYLACDI